MGERENWVSFVERYSFSDLDDCVTVIAANEGLSVTAAAAKFRWLTDALHGLDRMLATVDDRRVWSPFSLALPSVRCGGVASRRDHKREASRQAIDVAVAKLGGAPFARAIHVALAAGAEHHDLSRPEIQAMIVALQHLETLRPVCRDLRALARRHYELNRRGENPFNRLQRECGRVFRAFLGVEYVDWDYDACFMAYEPARSKCT